MVPLLRTQLTDDMDTAKRRLRAQAKANRAACAAAGGADAALRLAEMFFDYIKIPAGTVVGAYWPIRDEIDVAPLMHGLLGRGAVVALPVVGEREAPLAFRVWHPAVTMADGELGTSHPPEHADEVRPTLLVVPMLAFDRLGHRLGYGGGYYDRTIAALRSTGSITVVGVAFAGQELDHVPTHPGDETLDWVITEAGAVRAPGLLLPE